MHPKHSPGTADFILDIANVHTPVFQLSIAYSQHVGTISIGNVGELAVQVSG